MQLFAPFSDFLFINAFQTSPADNFAFFLLFPFLSQSSIKDFLSSYSRWPLHHFSVQSLRGKCTYRKKSLFYASKRISQAALHFHFYFLGCVTCCEILPTFLKSSQPFSTLQKCFSLPQLRCAAQGFRPDSAIASRSNRVASWEQFQTEIDVFM